MAAPFDDNDWPYPAYAHIVDYTLLMAYDQHDDTGPAGSIAAQDWFEKTLDKRMRALAPSHTIVGVGSYGYDWNSGRADDLSFEDAVVAAHDSEATIDFDDATNNPHFSYIEDDHTTHDVWFLDAVTAYNQMHASDIYRPAGYALWRIGTEDPSIWEVMGRGYGAGAPDGLRQITLSSDIDYEGEGEFIRVEAEPSPGSRKLEINADTGDIDDESYTKLPTNFVIRQFGYSPGEIALTFDDGPDAEWTPQILDILKEKHVKATFFIIGGNAEAHPDLVQRIFDEGHELGNHTYTHPNLADTPTQAVTLELNATQRLFEALTGRSLVLFRPPYLGDAEPDDDSEIIPVEIAQSLGYITVGEHIDPIDWSLPGADTIVSRVLFALDHAPAGAKGNTILLHDAGGDRAQTVAALPVIIDKLRARGYRFVRASQLIGLTRDQAMPPLSLTVSLLTDRVVFLAMSWLSRALYYAFLAAIWLGASRLFFLVGLSLWNARNEVATRKAPPEESLHVTVIIPAYNEEKVIVKTVEHILRSDHKDLDVLVIDDGSADNTSGVLQAAFGDNGRVTLIRVVNGGKAAALNVGLGLATGDILVALDADTHSSPTRFRAWCAGSPIRRSARWRATPRSATAQHDHALAGARIYRGAEPGTPRSGRARHADGHSRPPSAPGANRSFRRWGGFHSDTLAEDQDLTIGLQTKGYRVRFDPSAIAWTEAPSTFRGLARAALPLGLRHAAMPVEISRPDLQSALWRAWSVRVAAGLAVPDRAHGAGAARRSAADLAARQPVDRLCAARFGIQQCRSHHRGHLLRRVHRRGSSGRDLRLPDGARRGNGAFCGGCLCSASAIASSCTTSSCVRSRRRSAARSWAGASSNAPAP